MSDKIHVYHVGSSVRIRIGEHRFSLTPDKAKAVAKSLMHNANRAKDASTEDTQGDKWKS